MATYTHYPSERVKQLLHSYHHVEPFIHVDRSNPVIDHLFDLTAPQRPARKVPRIAPVHYREPVVHRRPPSPSMVAYRNELRRSR